MLSKPYAGWTNVAIGEFKGNASYLTDVPMDCLIAFINALEYYIPASVFFDEEGSEFTLVVGFNGVYVISEREETRLISVDRRFLDIARELVKDIEDNLEDWVLWDIDCYYSEEDDEEYKTFLDERRSILTERLSKLKELIVEEEKRYKVF